MNIEAPTGETVENLLVLISNRGCPYSLTFSYISVSTTFSSLKGMVWERSTFMGLDKSLGNSNHYHWEFINKDGEVDCVLVMDEAERLLSDINWSLELDAATTKRPPDAPISLYTTSSFLAVLRLVPTPNAALHETQMKINKLIGASMERQRFDPEVRCLANDVCAHKRQWVEQHEAAKPVERLMMQCPLHMAKTTFKPAQDKERVHLKLKITDSHVTTQLVNVKSTATQVIESLIDFYTRFSDQLLKTEDFVLKVVGRDQYLSGNTIVCQHKDVKLLLDSQGNYVVPALALVHAPSTGSLPQPISDLVLVRSHSSGLPQAPPPPPPLPPQLMGDGIRADVDTETVAQHNLVLTTGIQVQRDETGAECRDEKLFLLIALCHGSLLLTPCQKVTLKWMGPPTTPRANANANANTDPQYLRLESGDSSTSLPASSNQVTTPLVHQLPTLPTNGESQAAAEAGEPILWLPPNAPEPIILEELAVSDLPRSARVCFALVAVSDGGKVLRHLGWANLPVFNHLDFLNEGMHVLRLWPEDDYVGPRRETSTVIPPSPRRDSHANAVENGDYPDAWTARQHPLRGSGNRSNFLRPLGIPGSNPDPNAPQVSLRLHAQSKPGVAYSAMSIPDLRYPSLERMMELACAQPCPQPSTDETTQLRVEQLAAADVLQELAEQDKEFLWRHRFLLMDFGHLLPRLAQCVAWADAASVAQYYSLLQGWPHDADPLRAGMFLELLHHSCPDRRSRDFAVERGLARLDDSVLASFLPQLVQCLKYEAYIDSALARLLLRRAVVNPEIGNALYYLMRAEMRASACVAERFAHLLNVYFLCCTERIDDLYRAATAVERLGRIQRCLRGCELANVKVEFQRRISQWSATFANLRNPLFVDIRLHQLDAKSCVVFDSKMRPFLLRWSSSDDLNVILPRHSVIYKWGDDLRQDVLTVQILEIMEMIWGRDELPLRLFPYRVLTLGPREGFIETIWKAETVSSIRRKMRTGNGTNYLYLWLQECCERQGSLLCQAVEQFRRTCAAYCVATYVLGIGDRHNDNIMVTHSGMLYHIDFGHFLGNYKRLKIVNIAREFSSFLLVEEFKFVISNGEKEKEALQRFRRMCVDGFMSLRRHANLILTLFLNMCDVGMPELTSVDNLEFLRSRLCLDKSDKEAEEEFQQKMAEDDTFFRKLSVKTTWAAHDIVHKK